MLSRELLIASFLGVLVFASLVSRYTKTPYTLTLVILGIALAILADFSTGSPISTILQQVQAANDSLVAGPGGGLFVALVVPPLIFEALMHVKARDLKEVIRPAFALATVGVIISTIVGGYILWKVAGLPFYVSFLFAALISPTDVATVLEIFRRAKVPSRLAALMDTEAAFNDATGIVVFTVLVTSFSIGAGAGAPAGIPIFNSILNFILIFGGGALIGAGVAFGAELVTSRITDRTSEVILTIAAVYGSYAAATAFGFSGLIAVAVVGLYFGNYTIRKAIAPTTRESVSVFWQIAAFVGNSIAFLFIGLQTDLIHLANSFASIAIACLAVLLARVASVYPILTIFSRFGSLKIPFKWQNVAVLGGTRGALSIALAASIPVTVVISKADINTIRTMVLGVAFISISLQSGFLFRYIWRRFPEEQEAKNEELGVRLSRAVAAIAAVQDLKKEGKISDEELADQLENGKNELEEAIAEIRYDVDTTAILKSRATELYSALVQPIESMLARSDAKKSKGGAQTEKQTEP
jgi:monovalent cation:H+ antiporter, CPA1 family